MTSQIILINQVAVAVASDTLTSRVSGGDWKTYPSQSKLLVLNDPHLVVMAHSGSTVISNTNWRLLAREWGSTLEVRLNTIDDYVDSFSRWVGANAAAFGIRSKDTVAARLGSYEQNGGHIGWLGIAIRDEVLPMVKNDPKAHDEKIASAISGVISSGYSGDLFTDLSEEEANSLLSSSEIDLSRAFSTSLDLDGPAVFGPKTTDALNSFAVAVLRQIASWESHSLTINFAGFGKQEILGKIATVEIFGFWGGVLRTKVTEVGSDDPGEYPFMLPIAQTSAIDAFTRGISFNMYATTQKAIVTTLTERIKVDEDHAATLADEVMTSVMESSGDLYAQPFFSTLNALGISNLGKFADFLIHLQAFRAATDEGEATVGGLVESLTICPERGVRWRHRLSSEIHDLESSTHVFD